MSKETDKHIEKFIDKTMKEINLESPSIDFTNNIMNEVVQFNQVKVTTYQPLISKNLWVVIFLAVICMTTYILSTENLKQLNWLSTLHFKLDRLLPNIIFSNTAFYVLIVSASLILTQLILLKNYFNKRLEL